MLSEEGSKPGVLFKLKMFFRCGIYDRNLYRRSDDIIIAVLKNIYYIQKMAETVDAINRIEKDLSSIKGDPLAELRNESMIILKNRLTKKYSSRDKRQIFNGDDLWKKPEIILSEYPVILSTTFSARNSLNNDTMYDYVIVDEASQVDIATGSLAMSCARNIVIVGDTKQLPHVVPDETAKEAEKIFNNFNISEGYRYEKSFLQSVLEIVPDVPQTILREHYRCHPKIINFCNQKFYRNELVIMTEDKGEEDVLKVVKTVRGNHIRNKYSQRQIDIIKQEIIGKYDLDMSKTGIIAPYKNQANAVKKQIKDSDSSTVHKFQGREKDNIIISTVDDQISDFADDPNLINVAVSRAKKRLILVVTGNPQDKERNIIDLMNYIKYNNFEVIDSKIYSIFDYLYKQYDEERKIYLQRHKRISEYDSENLMYGLIEDILSDDKYASLGVICHFPMNMLIKDHSLLNERENEYAANPATHIDFLIYSRLSKKPVLAIEVDGYDYHTEGTEQSERDILKDHIMELYGIELLRVKTNGSGWSYVKI